jgi:hypothetical protein
LIDADQVGDQAVVCGGLGGFHAVGRALLFDGLLNKRLGLLGELIGAN